MFSPLHAHSIYSFFDGLMPPETYIEACMLAKSTAMALTDHGSMSGLPLFHAKAKENGVKPILGIETYFTVGGDKVKDNYHLVLLCKNLQGYRNLVKLNNWAVRENFYYVPRVTFEKLAEYSEGLICLSACVQGYIPRLIGEDKIDLALAETMKFKNIFRDDFYLELQFNEIPRQKKINRALLVLAEKLGIEPVVTNDIHYRTKEDFNTYAYTYALRKYKTLEKAEEALRQTGETMGDGGKELWVKGERQIRADSKIYGYEVDAKTLDKLFASTSQIAEKVENFDFDKKLKMFQMEYSDTVHEFKSRTMQGFRRLIADGFIDKNKSAQYLDRLKNEVSVIEKNGFVEYILLVADVVKHMHENGVETGPGRGSAVGCLVSYCLDITRVDPIKYGLYFERFINPDRVSLPDIDIDYSDRTKACELLASKYGDKVVKIGTFLQCAARMALKDSFRFFGLPMSEQNITKSFSTDSLQEELNENEEVKKKYHNDSTFKKAYDYAMVICGKIRGNSTHASGIAILPDKDAVPIAKVSNEIITSYEGTWLEKMGYLKLDVLGLSNLPAIIQTCNMIGKQYTDLYKLDMEADEQIFEEFGKGNTIGVFQMENHNTTSILKKIGKLETFTDIPVLISIIRPGLDVDGFVKNYTSGDMKCLPNTEETLKESHGILVYQEQVMRLCREIAGMTMAQADQVRKDIAKKTGAGNVLSKRKNDFINGALANGFAPDLVQKIWDSIENCGLYIFNKSHATAYSIISYFCMWLKVHYPVEFLVCCMNEIKNHAKYFIEAKRMGLEFLPLDINKSGFGHTIEDGKIRLGLGFVKGVNTAFYAIEKLRPFKSFGDFLLRTNRRGVGISSDVIEALIDVGALESLYINRANAKRVFKDGGKAPVSSDMLPIFVDAFEKDIQKKEIEDYSEEKKRQIETELYEYSLKPHPIEKYMHLVAEKQWELPSTIKGEAGKWYVLAQIEEIKRSKTSKGDDFIWLTIGDGVESMRVPLWNDSMKLHEKDLVIGNIVAIKVEIKDNGWANIWKKNRENKGEKVLQVQK
jgi:DNA polymerase-3 subunit alpha